MTALQFWVLVAVYLAIGVPVLYGCLSVWLGDWEPRPSVISHLCHRCWANCDCDGYHLMTDCTGCSNCQDLF